MDLQLHLKFFFRFQSTYEIPPGKDKEQVCMREYVCESVCMCVCSRLLIHQHDVAERREYYLPRRGSWWPPGVEGEVYGVLQDKAEKLD